MNRKTIFTLSAILLTAAILTGCQEETPIQQGIPQTNSGKNINSIKEPVDKNQNATQSLVTPSTPASEADKAAFEGALQLKDKLFCEKIIDAKYKAYCLKTVNSSIANSNAQITDNSTDCDKLSTADLQSACKINLEVQKAREQKELEIQKANEDRSALLTEIIASGSVQECSKLDTEGSKASCETTILSNKAIMAKDSAICSQASSEKLKNACLEAFELSS